MSKHTPGPWSKGKNRTQNCILSQGLVVAQVNHYPLDPEQSDANLALIAAAPDLLAALESVLAYDDNSLPWDECNLPKWLIDEVRAAVQKARGE